MSAYGCDGTPITSNVTQDTSITSISGDHLNNLTNLNVEALRIWENCNLTSIPSNIAEFFPNLLGLWINDCKFYSINSESFLNLSKIIEIDLAFNQIQIVAGSSFKNLKNLEFLYLNGNEILHIGANILQTLENLVYVSFIDNFCISKRSYDFDEDSKKNLAIDFLINCGLSLEIIEDYFRLEKKKVLEIVYELK